jgi:hypothetical protein
MMKVRQGFVSNSSSSCFIIGCRGVPTVERLLEWLAVPEKSPLHWFAKEMAVYLVENAETADSRYAHYAEENRHPDYKALKEKGLDVFFCTASSDGYGTVEQALYNMSFDNMATGEDLIIKKLYD